ncbi:MAG: galactose oxidase [Gammaproteobacteria bacterium]|nr:galactose oxidase [Gammaproteobacteria bacterium]
MRQKINIFFALLFLSISAQADATSQGVVQLPDLPRAMSNNAVASVKVDSDVYLLSALGLGEGKTWRDTLSAAYLLKLGDRDWQKLVEVPGEAGRLAATAIGVGGVFYVFGGYTVAEDGAEKSIATLHSLDPVKKVWRSLAPMPVPVDDAVSFSYLDRYIYLVSGWHDLGNVNLVQVYDIKKDEWHQATPYPGTPVFGHAGGIVGGRLIICDGVKITVPPEGSRKFESANECYKGEIDTDDFRRINWNTIPAHPGPALYRMAAAGDPEFGEFGVIFAGGSDNPYNYDGIGYDGNPSKPVRRIFYFDFAANAWKTFSKQMQIATMDHRGLLFVGRFACVVGGMRDKQTVSRGAYCHALSAD